EDDQVDVVLLERGDDLGFLLTSRLVRHGYVPVLDAIELDELAVVGMIADHERDVRSQLAAPPPVEKILDAVRLAGDEHREALALFREPDIRGHREAARDRCERLADRLLLDREPTQLELDPLEEDALLEVRVLLRVHDVAAALGDQAGDGGDDPGLVRTRQEE